VTALVGDGLPFLRAAASLAAVLLLAAGALWLMRRHALGPGATRQRADRLALVASQMIDGRVRVVLLRRDGREHLLAVGPAGVTLIESLPEGGPLTQGDTEPC
jgi:flagellar protein FliO/FliZ